MDSGLRSALEMGMSSWSLQDCGLIPTGAIDRMVPAGGHIPAPCEDTSCVIPRAFSPGWREGGYGAGSARSFAISPGSS